MSFFQNIFAKLKREHNDDHHSEHDDDLNNINETPPTTPIDTIVSDDDQQDIEIVIPQVEDEKIDPFTHKKEIPFLDGKGELEITNVPEEEAPPLTIAPIVPPSVIDPEDLAKQLVENYGEYDPRLDLSDYRFPTIELLSEPKERYHYQRRRTKGKQRYHYQNFSRLQNRNFQNQSDCRTYCYTL